MRCNFKKREEMKREGIIVMNKKREYMRCSGRKKRAKGNEEEGKRKRKKKSEKAKRKVNTYFSFSSKFKFDDDV
jgi:hypothetical protein